MYHFIFYFSLFFTNSILGWAVEVLRCSIEAKKYVPRGFLIGPYCPIYGYAALIMLFIFNNVVKEPIFFFIIVTLIATILEFISSYVMEKLFKFRWWDYSNRKLNINGRVCLSAALLFGILGVTVIYFINPFVISFISNISHNTLIFLGLFALILFITDNIISFNIIYHLNISVDDVRQDATEIITKNVKEVIINNSIIEIFLSVIKFNFKNSNSN